MHTRHKSAKNRGADPLNPPSLDGAKMEAASSIDANYWKRLICTQTIEWG